MNNIDILRKRKKENEFVNKLNGLFAQIDSERYKKKKKSGEKGENKANSIQRENITRKKVREKKKKRKWRMRMRKIVIFNQPCE